MDRVEYFIVSDVKLYPNFIKIQYGIQSYCYHHYISVNWSFFDNVNALSRHIMHVYKSPCVSFLLCTRQNKAAVIRLIADYCLSKAHIVDLLWLKLLLSMTFERKRNNSDSFLSIRRKTYHLFDGCELCSTFLLIPLPCFFRVAASKLIFRMYQILSQLDQIWLSLS